MTRSTGRKRKRKTGKRESETGPRATADLCQQKNKILFVFKFFSTKIQICENYRVNFFDTAN